MLRLCKLVMNRVKEYIKMHKMIFRIIRVITTIYAGYTLYKLKLMKIYCKPLETQITYNSMEFLFIRIICNIRV